MDRCTLNFFNERINNSAFVCNKGDFNAKLYIADG